MVSPILWYELPSIIRDLLLDQPKVRSKRASRRGLVVIKMTNCDQRAPNRQCAHTRQIWNFGRTTGSGGNFGNFAYIALTRSRPVRSLCQSNGLNDV
jgi:hypothetical protein